MFVNDEKLGGEFRGEESSRSESALRFWGIGPLSTSKVLIDIAFRDISVILDTISLKLMISKHEEKKLTRHRR